MGSTRVVTSTRVRVRKPLRRACRRTWRTGKVAGKAANSSALKSRGRQRGLGPLDQPIGFAQALATPPIEAPGLMQPHDRIEAQLL
jgi:hypothetical protein